MFKINKSDCVMPIEKILYNIMELLQQKEVDVFKTIPEENKDKEQKQYICKTCGKKYDNTGSLLACARKHKKEGK